MLVNLATLAIALLFCIAVVHGAVSDITAYKIPNWVSVTLAVGFVAFAALKWQQIPITLHVLLGLFVFIVCTIFWKLKWLGGGDVKYLGTISLWMGPQNILLFLIILSIVAGVFAFLLMWARRWDDYIQVSRLPRVVKLLITKAKDHACPYGFPTAIAALSVAPHLFWPI